jgi:hypothetical protein
MNILTRENMDTYKRDGIVHLPGVFKSWVDKLSNAFDTTLKKAEESPTPLEPLKGIGTPPGVMMYPLLIDRKYGDISVLHMMAYSKPMVDWLKESPAAEIMGEASGSKKMRFWRDAFFLKDSSSKENGTPWHNDYSTWPVWGEQCPILWIALTDVGPEDAPLLTLQGSHRDKHRYYSWIAKPGLETNAKYHPWQELLDKVAQPDAPIKAWIVKAGDCLVMHSKIIHASAPRTAIGPGRRLSFSTRWIGDDVIWAPDDYCAEPLFKTMVDHPLIKSGAKLPDELFPVIWQQA